MKVLATLGGSPSFSLGKLEWWVYQTCLLVLTECTNVTDRHTDGHRMTAKATLDASIARQKPNRNRTEVKKSIPHIPIAQRPCFCSGVLKSWWITHFIQHYREFTTTVQRCSLSYCEHDNTQNLDSFLGKNCEMLVQLCCYSKTVWTDTHVTAPWLNTSLH